MSSEAWWSVMTLAAQAGYEAVGVDRRSCGRSDDPGRGYDFDTWADDLADVIEAFDLKGLTLVGHSMGCAEIARYITRHGAARVSRIVMAAPSLPFMQKAEDNPDGPNDPSVIAEWQRLWATRLTEWLAHALGGAYGADTAPERVAQTMRILLGLHVSVRRGRARERSRSRRRGTEADALPSKLCPVQPSPVSRKPSKTAVRRRPKSMNRP
jgi:non-heme chloroperoxidase